MNQRVLLTGGTGLVGTAILERLLQGGHEVHALSRRPPSVAHPNLHWYSADLARACGPVLDRVPKVAAVVHAAARVAAGQPGNELEAVRKVNMEFTEALFQWSADRKVDTVVYLSGFNILRRPLAPLVDEDHPLAPLTPYAISKYWGELALARHRAEGHFRGIALRVSSPVARSYGLLHDTVVRKWIDLARCGKPPTLHGLGTRTQDFVDTEDVAQAVAHALETPRAQGVYNIASGVSLAMADLAKLIADHFETGIVHVGDDRNENERWNIAIDKAGAELGYVPRSRGAEVIDGLLRTIPVGTRFQRVRK